MTNRTHTESSYVDRDRLEVTLAAALAGTELGEPFRVLCDLWRSTRAALIRDLVTQWGPKGARGQGALVFAESAGVGEAEQLGLCGEVGALTRKGETE